MQNSSNDLSEYQSSTFILPYLSTHICASLDKNKLCGSFGPTAITSPILATFLITHLSFYVGWPNAWAAMPIAKEVYSEEK